ncbi:RPM1-interacting protein 4 [Apostasia shenzhenica]|uniref:RPM1-interacting protein 4 n=1 Tax=Apostasia shenzhenica TaxID=1088818 RepID=A0A2I0B0G2_9ASPA|nr:RPM1-interacting protein 4 [Apostasia shenzhenica]
MAQNAHVPQFGNWNDGGDVPYTQYFENARKGKNATKLINPNDPLENPEAFYQGDVPFHASPYRAPSNPGSMKVKHERQKSQEDVNEQQAVNYRSAEASSTKKPASESPLKRREQGNIGNPQRRASQGNGAFEQSVENSPLHHHQHIGSGSKNGVFSPSREKRSSSEKHGLAPNTPGRSKMKPSSDYVHDTGSAVPKFGEWDVLDPASADGYSYIFSQVSKEKHSGSTEIPPTSRESHADHRRQKTNSQSISLCCFSLKK